LVSHWAQTNKEQDIRVLTCKDLSTGGWRHYLNLNSSLNSISVIGGKEIPTRNIEGVLTRLTYITHHELPHITLKDREYVASEMMAFLVCWLSFLRCPVLNRPSTPICLCGPNWMQEQWIHAASKVGIPVLRTERRKKAGKQPFATTSKDSAIQVGGISSSNKSDESNNINSRRKVNATKINGNPDDPTAVITITVVGNRCLADPAIEAQDLLDKSLCLARLAGVDLLSIKYVKSSSSGEYIFASSEPCPSILPGTHIEKAVLDYLQARV
jgi:hypothetical protein